MLLWNLFLCSANSDQQHTFLKNSMNAVNYTWVSCIYDKLDIGDFIPTQQSPSPGAKCMP